MGRKIKIKGDLYDEDILAYVRKIRKPAKAKELEDGTKLVPSQYVVALKQGYSLDGAGEVTSIFMSEEEGKSVIEQLEAKESPRPRDKVLVIR